MESTMKTEVLAKKLRARLVVLKKQRVADRKAFTIAFEKWVTESSAWAAETVPGRVAKLRPSDLGSRYYENAIPSSVLAGAPKPPKPPSDEAITSIQKTLRMLGITGQATIRVDSSDINRWFGPKGGEDD